jgi:glycosyltransferase involved in cell wall biosynthesis
MSEASAAPPRAVSPLRVSVDATPLLGNPTGVGVFCSEVLTAMAQRADLAVSAFAVTWRRRRWLEGRLPRGVVARQRAMPARPLHAAWRRSDVPPIEWFVGGADVVHGTNFVVPPTRRAVRVVTVHDLTVIRYRELCDAASLRFPDLIQRAVDSGAWVHTPSSFVAGEVIEHFNVDPSRVRAVHSGVPAVSAVPLDQRTAIALPPGMTRYLLAVGTAEPRKDLPGLVRAFARLAGIHPHLALVLAGPAGWGSQALAEVIDASAHRERILQTGWVDDLTRAALLRGASVLAYPSIYEGFGFPPLEAMSVGVPVVTTRTGALPEIVGDAADLVGPRDLDALAGAIDRLLRDDSHRSRLIERGRARAAKFTWHETAAGLANLYRDACAPAGHSDGAP